MGQLLYLQSGVQVPWQPHACRGRLSAFQHVVILKDTNDPQHKTIIEPRLDMGITWNGTLKLPHSSMGGGGKKLYNPKIAWQRFTMLSANSGWGYWWPATSGHTSPGKSSKYFASKRHPKGKPCQQLHLPEAFQGICSGPLKLGI